MIKAEYSDRNHVAGILTASFSENKSVNYIIKQDRHRLNRIRRLMEYSFEICFKYGKVLLSDDRKGCALVMFPEERRNSLRSFLLDAGLIVRAIGLKGIRK